MSCQPFDFITGAKYHRNALVVTVGWNILNTSLARGSGAPGLLYEKCNRVCLVKKAQLAALGPVAVVNWIEERSSTRYYAMDIGDHRGRPAPSR